MAWNGSAAWGTAIMILVMSAAGCDVSVRPAPEVPEAGSAGRAAIGKQIDVQRGGLRLSATLRATDAPEDLEAEDTLYFELLITVRAGNYVFFPSLLKYYGSNDKPQRPRDTNVDGDNFPMLILQGADEVRTVVVENPASGPNGDLMVALYQQDGTRLATWSGR